MTIRYLSKLIPFLILVLLFGLLWTELSSSSSSTHSSSAMVGEKLPSFSLPSLSDPKKTFSSKDMQGKISLLNVWASWCDACKKEHAFLLTIKKQYHIPIYGILYKDDPNLALKLLLKTGDPYETVGTDEHGDAAIDLGIYGTPETFLVDAKGVIIYRHIGILTKQIWDDEINPIIHGQAPSFGTAQQTQLYTKIIKETRCIVCQNQSLAESDAPLAMDLKQKIHDMIAHNKSEAEIKDYLVKRYGESILLRPRWNKLTALLWTFPLLGLLIVCVIFFVSRK